MSFLGKVLKGAAGGFLAGGPWGALAGGAMGAVSGGGGGGGGNGGMDQAAADYGGYAKQDRNRFLDALNNGQEALNTSTRAAVSSAMPGFQRQIQGIREGAIRRGASNGDLATSYEGDAASAFDKNITDSVASQATALHGQQLAGYGGLASESGNHYLDLMAGNRDAEQAKSNNKYGLLSGVIGAAGQLGGAYLGRRT